MELASTIYRRLLGNDPFTPDQLDPVTITSQIFECYDQCKNNVESLLLWLSIIRKVFTPVPTSAPAEVPIPSSLGLDLVSVSASAKRATNSSAREIVDLKPVQRTLLRASALVPALIACFTSGDQLVCYLASKVLHLVLLASQWIEEEWVAKLFPTISHPSHECLYTLQLFKQLLKSVRKTERETTSFTVLYRTILSCWKDNLMDLSSKLKNKDTKWPELNFVSFLSLSVELLHCTQQKFSTATSTEPGCIQIVGDSLEDLTTALTQHCGGAISLKGLLKLYNTFVGTCAVDSDYSGVQQLEACLPILFSCPGLLGAVSDVLEGLGATDVLLEIEGAHNLSRLVARKTALFLMKYGSHLEKTGEICSFEVILGALFRQCGLELPRGISSHDTLPSLRHSLFQVMNEQDDDILDMLAASCKLWRKRALWTTYPTLQFCLSLTNLHSMFHEFLLTISYDHSILLDFIMSPETVQFYQLLVEYLEICCSDWTGLVSNCQELDCHDASQMEIRRDGGAKPRDSLTASCAAPYSSPMGHEEQEHEEQEVYQETTLDKIMDCFTRFKYSLVRLSASNLLPVPADTLVSILNKAEDLYENS